MPALSQPLLGQQSTGVAERETVLLDACAVINLCATRHLDDVLADLPYRFAIADIVSRDETLYAVSYTHLTLPTTPYV